MTMTEKIDRVRLRQHLSHRSSVASVGNVIQSIRATTRPRSCTRILLPKSWIASEVGMLGLPENDS